MAEDRGKWRSIVFKSRQKIGTIEPHLLKERGDEEEPEVEYMKNVIFMK